MKEGVAAISRLKKTYNHYTDSEVPEVLSCR